MNVVDNVKVQVPIAVVIEEGCATSQQLIPDARLIGDVRECTIAVVLIKYVRAEIRDVEIGVPVVVIVGARGAHSVIPDVANTCLCRGVCKRSVAVVTVENTREFFL